MDGTNGAFRADAPQLHGFPVFRVLEDGGSGSNGNGASAASSLAAPPSSGGGAAYFACLEAVAAPAGAHADGAGGSNTAASAAIALCVFPFVHVPVSAPACNVLCQPNKRCAKTTPHTHTTQTTTSRLSVADLRGGAWEAEFGSADVAEDLLEVWRGACV
jgi:hypothetical protein